MFPVYRRRSGWQTPLHWNPNLLDEHFPGPPLARGASYSWMPDGLFSWSYPVDMEEDEGTITVEVELPGFTKDQIRVSIDGDVMRIHAERESREPRGIRHLSERNINVVDRLLRLPVQVDESKADARLKEGVLTITVPVHSSGGGREIAVK